MEDLGGQKLPAVFRLKMSPSRGEGGRTPDRGGSKKKKKGKKKGGDMDMGGTPQRSGKRGRSRTPERGGGRGRSRTPERGAGVGGSRSQPRFPYAQNTRPQTFRSLGFN